MINLDENRNYFRMMMNATVEIKILDEDVERAVYGTCRDLSATGLSIEVNQPIEVGTSINCKIDNVGMEPIVQLIQATITRCVQHDTGVFIVGAEVIEQM